jgi:cell division protein FtsN/opacity protein-like surface antigen
MNQVLKKAFVLFVLFSSTSLFAQKGNYDLEPTMPFQPMFSFGTAYHSFQGNIMGPATNSLLGNMGYRAGMRFNLLESLDASLLFSNTSFYEKNDEAEFESNVDAVGLHLGYFINIKRSRVNPYLTAGVQSLSFKTLNKDNQDDWSDRESAMAIPLGLGIRLNISERIDLDATLNYTIAMGDIDKSVEEASDKFMSANFTLHYDLFTPKPKENYYVDDSYYADVDFNAMDIEDADGDLVADVDDYCPKTPIGVKVDQFGCPLDGDNDGIPDYIDQEKNTRKGAVVDEIGVQLTDEKYHSMYSDFDAASREYANFYNENEIKRENYKTIDEYLIAKANAFNKAYNEGVDFDNKVAGLQYKVKIGAYSDGIPANVINKYLSLDDLESIPQDDGVVIYAVGTYATLEDALGREYELEAKGFDETSILVDNNGEVSDYVAPKPEPIIEEKEEVVEEEVEVVEIEKEEVKEEAAAVSGTIYRVQVGAFEEALSDQVFVGLDNIISFTGKDGLLRYMAGSFTEYNEAVNYMHQMRARGFEDAFVVTYKDGERISLNVAIKTETQTEVAEENIEEEVEEVKLDISYTVQVLVGKESLSAEDLKKLSELGNIDKEAEGEKMYRYFVGTYNSLEEANARLQEAKLVGFADAFVFATLDGERITLEEVKELLK